MATFIEAATERVRPTAPVSRETVADQRQSSIGERWEGVALRIGFFGAGASLLSVAQQAWARGQITSNNEVVAMVIGLYALAFGLLALGVCPRSLGQRLRWTILAASIAGLAVFSYVMLEIALPTYQTDNAVFSHVAAERLLEGQNPYTIDDPALIEQSAERFGLPVTFLTHTTDGEPLTNLMSWPAGTILPLAPFLQFGGSDVRWVVAGFEATAMILLWLAAPRALKPLSVLPLLVDPDLYLQFTGGGVMDFVWVVPMMGSAMALYGRRFVLSALLFGLAAGTKQQPWLLTPFLLIYVAQIDGGTLRERAVRVATYTVAASAGFLALNGPFIAWGPQDWLSGTLIPFSEQLVPFGSGLSMLTQTGIADLGKSFYSAATFGVWAVLILAYGLHFRTLRHTLWLMPAIVMWFGYRSLQNYFIYWTPLLIMAGFAWWREEEAGAENMEAAG
jgi:uncharacterized membrane protein